MFTKKFSAVSGEAGVSWLPTNKDCFCLNATAEGVAGNRVGVVDSLRLNYHFQTITATEKSAFASFFKSSIYYFLKYKLLRFRIKGTTIQTTYINDARDTSAILSQIKSRKNFLYTLPSSASGQALL